MALEAAIDSLLGDEVLYDPLRVSWRHTVVDDAGEPRPIPISHIVFFAEISTCLSRPPTHPESIREVADAARRSTRATVVTVGDDVCIKRTTALTDDADPIHRTIVVRPIHHAATDDDIEAFFCVYGAVESVARAVFCGAGGGERTRSTATVRFTSRDAAMRCVAAAPSYGELLNALGQHFVPPLIVQTQAMANASAALHVDRREAAMGRQLTAAAVAALAVPASPNASSTTASGVDGANVSRYLTRGRTLIAEDIPTTSTWRTVKEKLGNLATADKTLVGAIELVHVEGSTAYVVLRSASLTHTLLTAWAAKGGPFAAALHEALPKLRIATESEDSWVRARFPTWAVEHKRCKVIQNGKRQRNA